MKKQIIYAKLIPRLFATTIDLFLLTLITTPIMSFTTKYVFALFASDFLKQYNINIEKIPVEQITRMPEFIAYVQSGYFSFTSIIGYISVIVIQYTIIIGLFFISFWQYTDASPGKMLLHLKIVDADTLNKPTINQYFKRALWYFTALFGVWGIILSKRKQALHDKIAHTIVIKA